MSVLFKPETEFQIVGVKPSGAERIIAIVETELRAIGCVNILNATAWTKGERIEAREVPASILQARTIGELIADAVTLLDEGRYVASACSARAALDSHLRRLHREHKLPPVKREVIGEYSRALKRAGVIEAGTKRIITELARIGGRAVHNEPVSADEVSYLVDGVAAIVEGGGA